MSDVDSHIQDEADAAHEEQIGETAAAACAAIAGLVEQFPSYVDAVPSHEDVGTIVEVDTDAALEALILLDELHKATKHLHETIDARVRAIKKDVTEWMVETGKQSVSQSGKLIYVASDRWPRPAFRDILPPHVDVNDPQYKTTVESARKAGKVRLINALKDSEFSDLVREDVNAQSMRGRFCGDEPPATNDIGEPVCPDSLMKRDGAGELVLDTEGNPIPLIDISVTPTVRVKNAPKK